MKFLNLREKCRAWKPALQRLAADKKKAAAIALCILALFFLALSEWTSGTKQKTQPPVESEDYAAQLEEKLGALLSAVDGAGKTRVMITLRAGEETVFARDDRIDTQESRTQSEQSYVTLRDGSRDTGLPLKTLSPQILGVAIVCEGADVPQVRQAITQTVTAALGIGASHVSVVKGGTAKHTERD